MNKVLAIIPKLKFSLNLSNPNPTKYLTKQPNTKVVTRPKTPQLYARKLNPEIKKQDIFVSNKIEIKPENTTTKTIATNLTTPKKKSGRQPIRKVLEKYFDNDKPQNDYLTFFEDAQADGLKTAQKYRTVENAEEMRKFAQKPLPKFREELYNEELQEYANKNAKKLESLNSLEKKYTDKTNEYINYDKNMQNYLKNFAETEEIEKAKQIEQERMENTLNAYVNQLNSRNPHEHNHKKQRRGEMLKFY
ncbi:hypothetical protein J6O48_14180 [bacterium]|nr:hypothetical protein [bacterium]